MPATSARLLWRDVALALVLAFVLSAAWVLRDWPDLSRLRLPDTDDAMRLQQIRDWLGGQAFADLAQHRLGAAPGLEMHWSRLPDLVPAGIIATATPLLGGHGAELAAVIVWPALLFAAALILTAGIARTLDAPAPVAVLVAALAYPATTLYLPGRIDHHGLQLVLILLLVRAAIGPGNLRGGAVAGVATAASLAIGLETAPLLAIGGAALVLRWSIGSADDHARLLGYGYSVTLALAAAGVLLRSSGWNYAACDGFTAELWRAAAIAGLVPLALGVAGFALADMRARLAVVAVVAFAGGAAALLAAPGCLHPYGQVDPLLARLWLAQVAEAQPLFRAPLASAIGYAGLALAGLAACAAIAWRRRDMGWTILLAFQLTALAVTLFQLRGAYGGALLAAPALAAMIAAARMRNLLALATAWIASAGITYPLVADALAPGGGATTVATPALTDCTGPEALTRIAALPPGRLMAPVDLGAFALVASRHRVVAAPYHRNNRGNRAMYDFFLGNAARSEEVARQWGIDYVAFCPGDFGEAGAARDPAALIGALEAGHAPAWLQRLSQPGESPAVYARTTRR